MIVTSRKRLEHVKEKMIIFSSRYSEKHECEESFDKLKSIGIWHKRMGHPSEKVIRRLPVVDRTSMNISGCDICFLAKQCRSEFYLSEDKRKECFEMIHCDIWGPYRTHSFSRAYYFLTIVDNYSRAV